MVVPCLFSSSACAFGSEPSEPIISPIQGKPNAAGRAISPRRAIFDVMFECDEREIRSKWTSASGRTI